MGSRQLPTDCPQCGGVLDWGDFGPDPDDGSVGTTCTCTPPSSWKHRLAKVLRW